MHLLVLDHFDFRSLPFLDVCLRSVIFDSLAQGCLQARGVQGAVGLGVAPINLLLKFIILNCL